MDEQDKTNQYRIVELNASLEKIEQNLDRLVKFMDEMFKPDGTCEESRSKIKRLTTISKIHWVILLMILGVVLKVALFQ